MSGTSSSSPSLLDKTENVKVEASMEEDSFMQLNHKDMKKWYNDNPELKSK